MLNYVQFRYKANTLINSRDYNGNEVLTVYATLGDCVTFNQVYNMGEKANTHQKENHSPTKQNPSKHPPPESKTDLGFLGYHFRQCFSISLAAPFSKKYILLYDNLVHILSQTKLFKDNILRLCIYADITYSCLCLF